MASPASLATQDSVDKLTQLVESLHAKLDKFFAISNQPTVPTPTPVAPNLSYASVVRALADSEKIKAKSQRAVLVGSTEKATPEETLKHDEDTLKNIIECTKDKDLREAYANGSITHARFPANKEPGRRIIKYCLPSTHLRDKLLAEIRTIGKPSTFEPQMYLRRDLMPSELEQERSARDEARKRNISAGCLKFGVRDCELIQFRGPTFRPLPKDYIKINETNVNRLNSTNSDKPKSSKLNIDQSNKTVSKPTILATISEESVTSVSTSNASVNHVTTRKREDKSPNVSPPLSSGAGGTKVKDEPSHQ